MHAQPIPASERGDAIAAGDRRRDAGAEAPVPTSGPSAAEPELRCGILLVPAVGDAFGLLLPVGTSAEILRATRICSMPNTPPWSVGLANVRGNVVPVFDLLRYFSLGSVSVMRQQRADIVTVGVGTAAFAIPVKREPHILLVGANPAQAPPPTELRDFAGAAHLDGGVCWFEFLFDHWLARLAVDASPPSPHMTSSGEST